MLRAELPHRAVLSGDQTALRSRRSVLLRRPQLLCPLTGLRPGLAALASSRPSFFLDGSAPLGAGARLTRSPNAATSLTHYDAAGGFGEDVAG